MDVQVPNGVVDIAVTDESAAVQAAKKYLSYFQGSISSWECADQRMLRNIIPENRLTRLTMSEPLSRRMADKWIGAGDPQGLRPTR